MVGGRRRGLDDKHVLTPDILLDFDERFAVWKRLNGAYLPSSLPMDLQMARAKGSFDVPLKIFTR